MGINNRIETGYIITKCLGLNQYDLNTRSKVQL
jgi:hypothetical protein